MAERIGPWSDLENDAIVADYMAMLADDLVGRPYSKAEHNRQLQQLIGRGRGSIEYKHQNISAVLMGIGETWIEGYKPAFNYQASLEERGCPLAAATSWMVRQQGRGAFIYQSRRAARRSLDHASPHAQQCSTSQRSRTNGQGR